MFPPHRKVYFCFLYKTVRVRGERLLPSNVTEHKKTADLDVSIFKTGTLHFPIKDYSVEDIYDVQT